MSVPMTEAMKSAKQIQSEMVQWENRVEMLKADNERLSKTNSDLKAEIDKKTSDYNIYISHRDAETKKNRQDALSEREQLEAQKNEFKTVLQAFQNEKIAFAEEKNTLDSKKAQAEAQLNNVRQFILAVQRALSVLGL